MLHKNRVKNRTHMTSFQVIIISFFCLILVGTLLLMLPISSRQRCVTSFPDAMFTAVSATCVTGLVVKDTATYWSLFGQAVILMLIQIGGMGVITIGLAIIRASGRKIGLRQRSTMQESISAPQVGGIVKLTGFILKTSLIIEMIGAALLAPVFCNDIGTHKHRIRRFSLQSKVVLMTSAVLIVLPALYFFFYEYDCETIHDRTIHSLFQSVTTRTAGFNTTDLAAMDESGTAIMIILMLIGGSPGSTAGGMKTATFAVLFLSAITVLRRRNDVQCFKRRISNETVCSAGAVLFMYLVLFFTSGIIISRVENLPLLTCLFETSSAIGTVGLTLGITSGLSAVSRVILMILMFFGRVGGLTLIYAALPSADSQNSRLPLEKISIG